MSRDVCIVNEMMFSTEGTITIFFCLFCFLELIEVMNLEDMGSNISSPSSWVNLSQWKLRNVFEIQSGFWLGRSERWGLERQMQVMKMMKILLHHEVFHHTLKLKWHWSSSPLKLLFLQIQGLLFSCFTPILSHSALWHLPLFPLASWIISMMLCFEAFLINKSNHILTAF